MKTKLLLLITISTLILSGCSYLRKDDSVVVPTEQPLPSALTTTNTEPILDGNIHNLLVRENSFGTEEITVLQNETLILNIRNQLEEPINVVIDGLGIKSKEIVYGEAVEIIVPTNKTGEYEMYSSLGNQRNEGLSTIIIIDESSIEE